MSLFTQRERIEVSSGDSEPDSIASTIVDSADELIEGLARMALDGHYSDEPRAYETSQRLQSRGITPRPHEVALTRPSIELSRQTTPTPRASSSTPPFYQAPAWLSTQGSAFVPERTGVDVAEAESEARALAKLYRHLDREYFREKSIGDHSDSKPIASGRAERDDYGARARNARSSPTMEATPTHKPRRKPDETARLRLLVPSKTQLARRVEKYEIRKKREEEARQHPKRVRVPAEAVKRGTRLFLEAQERANNVKEVQKELAKQKAAQEKKECTFHPSVSRYAAQFAAEGAYYPLESRFEDQAAYNEKRMRLRLERAMELEKECTFKPTLSPGTEELMFDLRCRRERFHYCRSFRRPEAGEHARSRRRRPSPSEREPFEPGERLYRDGGERLLRQQVRLQRAAAKEQRHVVGGALRLSPTGAQQLAGRFTSWAATREANREQLRVALERQERETPKVTVEREAAIRRAGGLRFSRTLSSLGRSTATPRLVQSAANGNGSIAPAVTDASVLPLKNNNYFTSSTGSQRACGDADNCEASRVPSDRARSSQSPSGADCGVTATNVLRSVASLSAPETCPAVDMPVHKELLRIRLGALFYKYAVSTTATAVTLAQVKQQVRCYYPEDSGIAAALASSFPNGQQHITKIEFMAALARYVAQHGIQPWCLPHYNDPNTIVGAPYSSPASTTTGAAAAVMTNFLVNSAHLPDVMDNDAPGSIPSWTGTGTCGNEPGCRNKVDCSVFTPTTARASEGTSGEKPLRTHIYSSSLPPDCSPPTPAPTAVAPSCSPKGNRATAATTGVRGSTATSRGSLCDGLRDPTASKDTLPANSPIAAAEFVRGYADYVQRQRRAIDRARAVSKSPQRNVVEECTFRPTLTPRSVMLSDMNLEKRMAYVRELQLRRRNLQLLHTAVLAEGSGEDGLPRATPSKREFKARDALDSTQTSPLTPSTKHSSASLSGISPPSGLSPSIEVSSLSCSTPQHEGKSASSKPAATLSPPHQQHLAGDSNALRVIARLEQLLNDVAGKEGSIQATESVVRTPPPCSSVHADVSSVGHVGMVIAKDGADTTRTVSTVPLSRFFATKPAQAILCVEAELLESRHGVKTSRGAN
ncbi:hypothetical protein, conserved [Leishmania lindenbergi]|uniref:Uncharacterized protein n=1 Tax=Leishmania lindenbergi TaxID=651832 RepID=A0AAW2ZV81_9TRYP